MSAFGRSWNSIKKTASACILSLVVLSIMFLPLKVEASGLASRSLSQLSSTPGVTTDYTLTFTISNTITLGSLSLVICSNTPIQYDTCDLPAGFDDTNAQLTYQSGITDFSLFVPATNELLLTRTPSTVVAPKTVSLTFHHILNPSTPGPYYLRLSAYSSNNGTGSTVAFGGLAFDATNNVQVSSVVPPYLTFCSAVQIAGLSCTAGTGDYIDFGNLSSKSSSQATSQLLVATNAANGYTVQVYGTTMTAGNNVINALNADTKSQPGSAQFGVNLRANSIPVVGADPTGPGSGQPASGYDTPNQYRFVSNDIIAGSSTSDSYRKYTVSYLVNVPATQPPGIYASTLTYVAAGSF
jgi:hypothetical protein